MNQASLETNTNIYTEDELALVQQKEIPKHIAVIMDGNRRWAKNLRLPIDAGHLEGVEVIDNMVRAAAELGVQVMTTYTFSTENWTRLRRRSANVDAYF